MFALLKTEYAMRHLHEILEIIRLREVCTYETRFTYLYSNEIALSRNIPRMHRCMLTGNIGMWLWKNSALYIIVYFIQKKKNPSGGCSRRQEISFFSVWLFCFQKHRFDTCSTVNLCFRNIEWSICSVFEFQYKIVLQYLII